jgi:hypothetical protein
VGWTQIVFGIALVVVLLFVAILYFVRQIVSLRRLRQTEEMPLDERAYLLSRARRRLVNSILMFVLGIMLAVDLAYLEVPAQQLADQRTAQEQEGEAPPLDAEQRVFARLYGGFFVLFLLVLMVVIFLAAFDYWATRRYGLGQRRKLLADRRAMIEREVARLRQERNGHG